VVLDGALGQEQRGGDLAVAAALGSHTTHPNVRMRTGTRVQVEADRRVLVYADGELVGSLPAIFEVRPAALPVVVGPDARSVR
jgi:diacylglycerol kinase family enzyme